MHFGVKSRTYQLWHVSDEAERMLTQGCLHKVPIFNLPVFLCCSSYSAISTSAQYWEATELKAVSELVFLNSHVTTMQEPLHRGRMISCPTLCFPFHACEDWCVTSPCPAHHADLGTVAGHGGFVVAARCHQPSLVLEDGDCLSISTDLYIYIYIHTGI